jgi:quinolinate synthase
MHLNVHCHRATVYQSVFVMISANEIESGGPLVSGVRKPMPREQFDALSREILALKEKHNAVILAHNYQVPEIQDVADYVGDSLGLSQQAARTDADVIVFAGVHFMAETAKILNPGKKVVLPDKDAGCSLEESCPGDRLKALQDTNPNFWTVAYINCSAEVKALSDVICTSGNAKKIVEACPPDKDLLFVPDENLGSWVMEQTGRPMTLWQGNCYVHVEWTHAAITRIRSEHPDAPVVAHPECTKAVRMLADEVCSTEKMVTWCRATEARSIIIATEAGMLHRLQKECPDKHFIPAPTEQCACNECRFMKMNTLEKLRDCMEHLSPEVELDPAIMDRARLPIERMLEISAR